MIQIVVFVPETHKEKVKAAMFEAGGGKLGNYDRCCFEYQGIGQFRPLSGSQPFTGREGMVEKVTEVKVEMVCDESCFNDVVSALKSSHPYETPAFYGIKTVGL